MERGDQVLNHLLRAAAGLGREGLLDIQLTERLSQGPIGRGHAATPARQNFLRALHVLAVKAEILFNEFRR